MRQKTCSHRVHIEDGSHPMGLLAGKVVLVAGASRGIGLAIAQSMAEAGAEVIVASRSEETLKKIAIELKGRPLVLDMASSASIDAAVEACGPIDVLVNVAGTNTRKRFEEFTTEEIGAIFQSNLFGPMQLTQKIGRKMIERGAGGKIINIGSLTSMIGIPYISIYGASKGAVAEWTRCLAAEWGQHNIQVNCIAPGFILTDLNRVMWQAEELQDWLRQSQPNPRLGTPEDIGPIAVYLASPHSDYMTGQVLTVDGGHTVTAMWPFKPAS
ncbi:MAG TPA: SDR family oxidoreductase [Acidobacteriaceae bacterium]|nr:SDR family oxidoreductase [Acidobacteriaceae bacterium]